jgi:hypothetical protein
MSFIAGCGGGSTAITQGTVPVATASPSPTPTPTLPPVPTPGPTPTSSPNCKALNSLWTLSQASSTSIINFTGFGNNYAFWMPYLEGNYYFFDLSSLAPQTISVSGSYLTGVPVFQQEWSSGNDRVYAALDISVTAQDIEFTPVGCYSSSSGGPNQAYNCPIASYSFSYNLGCGVLTVNGAEYQ